MGRVGFWRRSGDSDAGADSSATPVITPSPTISRSTPIITLYDGRTVPAIMLDNGQFLTPTVKPNGDIETDVDEYTTTTESAFSSASSSASAADSTSATSVLPSDVYVTTTTFYSHVGSEGQLVPVTQTITVGPSAATGIVTEPTSVDADYNDQNFWDNFSQGAKAAIVIAIIFGFFAAIVACVWICCGRRRKKGDKEKESRRLDEEREMALQRSSAVPLGASVEQLGVPLRPMSTASREREEARLGDTNPVIRGGAHTGHGAHGSISRVASRLSRHMSLRGGGGGGFNDAPPVYEEVVPHAHQHLAGGMRHVNNNPIPNSGFQDRGNFGNDEEDGMGVVADGKMPLSEIPFEDVVLENTRSEGSSSRDFERRHHMGPGDTRGHTNS